ncbi:MAG: PorT family protein [Chitinophagaceae bacterium]|nr:PorT family protein [Chitinophagaceae bacterium]
MRKLLTAIIAVLFCSTIVFGQKMKQKAAFGFKAGVNVSGFRPAIDYQDIDLGPKLGQVFGAFVQIPISARVTIQPEFLYSQMGAKAKSTLWGDVTFRYNYFSIPILVKYNVVKSFNIYAGIENDILIRARQKQIYETSTITYDVKDFDFAYTAGIGTSAKKWTFDIRYIHGSQDVSAAQGENTFYNQAVQVTVGYKLHKKAKKAPRVKSKKTKK